MLLTTAQSDRAAGVLIAMACGEGQNVSAAIQLAEMAALGMDLPDVVEWSADGWQDGVLQAAPVALAHLSEPLDRADASAVISSLTHNDLEAAEASALWCEAIAHAILHGDFDGLRLAVDSLPAERRDLWCERLDEAERHDPSHFAEMTSVAHALQRAWSAVVRTPAPVEDPANNSFAAQHLQLAIEAASSGDLGMGAAPAMAGALLGARWGVSAVPLSWRRKTGSQHLVDLAVRISQRAFSDNHWLNRPDFGTRNPKGPARLGIHPQDKSVLMGNLAALKALPEEVDAVVTLCRIGSADLPERISVVNRVQVWLIDHPDPDENPHLDFVLAEIADVIKELRDEGRIVFVHCVAAESRTPAAGAAFSIRHQGVSAAHAVADINEAMGGYGRPNRAFMAALERLQG